MNKEKIEGDFKKALKQRDELRLSVLRMVLAAIKNMEIEEKGELKEDQITDVLSKEAKKRKDSIVAFRDAGREDLQKKEEEELVILEEYLPEALGEDEIKKVISEKISQLDAKGPADMGKVMGAVMGELKGQADGEVVKKIVQSLLK